MTALTLLLASPAVYGMVVGSTSPFEASLRLLAALVVALVVSAVMRRLLAAAPAPAGGPGATGVPRQRQAPPAAVAQTVPEELADRLR
ncbi:hypothetical protein WDV85_06270 [Pseudokineococcus sp. 5B2Z-1]|uniref:hypothetical protein n=1 Tax=Pseudokineococcus sp. 5B2Z-1 TaxID=3132744 RepID=UPI00309961A3